MLSCGVNLSQLIENHTLSLSVSTVVKTLTCFDKMMARCYYDGAPEYIHPSKCKFCHDYQTRLRKASLLCRKHYVVDLYNRPKIRVSNLEYRGVSFELLGRYALRRTPKCVYVFYMTPLHIDESRFCIYAFPPNDSMFKPKLHNYVWACFRRPGIFTYNLDVNTYAMDTTDQFHISTTQVGFQPITLNAKQQHRTRPINYVDPDSVCNED